MRRLEGTRDVLTDSTRPVFHLDALMSILGGKTLSGA